MNPSLQIFAASMNSSAESAQQATPSRTAPVRLGFALAVALLSAACSQAATPVAAEPARAPSPAPGNLVSANEPQSDHTSTTSPADRASSILKAVMEQQYGQSFDAKLGCWTYSAELPGGSQDFCMKPGAPSFVRSNGSEYLYFHAYSRSDIDDDPAYSYGHATPGLMGAFQVRIDSATQWKLMAASKEMVFGSVGNCGCQEARFIRLGRDLYGWQFASGGVWQGIAVFNHNLVAAHDGKFVDVSAIPQVAEDEQDIEYGIVVDDSDKDAPAYPLLVTKSTADGKKEDLKVSFDKQKLQYTLPTEN